MPNRRHSLITLAAGLAVPLRVRGEEAPPVDGLPPLRLQGRGTMRFLGFHLYDARLWADANFQAEQFARSTLVLELHYRRAFKAEAIAERSLEEMGRVGELSAAQVQRWQAALTTALPDVAEGDRLLGVHRPGKGAEFRRGGQRTGRVDDPVFSALFFGIWLSPKTSQPALRQALLSGGP